MKHPEPRTILPRKPLVNLPCIATWAEEYKRHYFPRIALNTQMIAEVQLRRFALWMGHREISGQLLYEFFDTQFRHVGPKTLSHNIVGIRGFLRWCEEVGHLPKRYSALLVPVKYAEKEPVMFTPDQFDRLKEAAKGTVWHYASILAYRTGARISDVCLLRWDNVDFENLYIRYIPFKSRKTGRYATCPFQAGGDLHEALKELDNSRSQLPHWDKFVCAELAMKYPADGNGGYSDGHASPFKKFCIKIGAPHLSFHSLRHSFFSRAVNAGTAFPMVSQLSGLASYSVLLRYARPDVNVLRNAIDRIDALDLPPESKVLALPAPAA